MKYTTIALALAFAIPSTFALARGGMHIGSHVTRPFASPSVQVVLQTDPGTLLETRLRPSRMIQADQQ
jgi:hypothetical protein